jgi:two-component system, OmpR family, sensor histidine kinase KdpD
LSAGPDNSRRGDLAVQDRCIVSSLQIHPDAVIYPEPPAQAGIGDCSLTETDRPGFLGAIRPRRITPVLRRALRAARRASSSESEIRNLYEFTRRTLQMNLNEKPGPQLAAAIADLFALDAVAIFDADLEEVYQAGRWSIDPGEMAQNVYHFETSDNDPHTGIGRRVIRLGTVPVGSLVLRGELSPLTNNALAALIAVTFDRYRATASESRMEAEREAERMRATVLDSLAHAYKTPLTAIRAASSGLAEMGHLSPAQSELVALIDEQASLLNELTTRLLTTASLGGEVSGAPALSLKLERVHAAALIADVVSASERSKGAPIRIEVDPGLSFLCDLRLVSMLLAQYLDNACKYSNSGSEITVRAERTNSEILLSVHSYGPVIPSQDRERIFDRYFRSSAASERAPGTGIGLSVAKRAAQAHGGSVWVSSDEREGTTFYASIPCPAEDSQHHSIDPGRLP